MVTDLRFSLSTPGRVSINSFTTCSCLEDQIAKPVSVVGKSCRGKEHDPITCLKDFRFTIVLSMLLSIVVVRDDLVKVGMTISRSAFAVLSLQKSLHGLTTY